MMNPNLIDKLKKISPWHFIWISVVSSELITLILSAAQGRIWWGGVSRETLIIGAVDALVVPLIVASLVIYFVRQTAEMQKVNDRLQEANRKLQELDRLKTDFISVVSHELRTPLTTIKAFVELLIIKPGMPRERKEKLTIAINLEAERLTRLINDLLDLARIESGSMRWQNRDFSIEDVIRNSIESMEPLFEAKRLSLSTRFSPGLPMLRGDDDRLVQVVMNVLSNAAKFTRPGGSISVTARLERGPGEQVIVEVADNGIGIADSDLELIFDKFRQSGDVLTSAREGSGLGLAIARQIIDHHGGRIWATSNPGKGSSFFFTLPVPDLSVRSVAQQ